MLSPDAEVVLVPPGGHLKDCLPHLMGFLPVKTASGRTKSKSSPEGSFQEVVTAPYRYTSATLRTERFPPCICTLSLYLVPVPCICTLYLYLVPVPCTCTCHACGQHPYLPTELVRMTRVSPPSPASTLTPSAPKEDCRDATSTSTLHLGGSQRRRGDGIVMLRV